MSETYIVAGPCPVSGHNPGEVVDPQGLDIAFLLAHGFIIEAPTQSKAKAEDPKPKES